MDKRIVFATSNAGKVKEIQMILSDLGYDVVSMKEAGIITDVEENGATYEENALIKARAVAAMTKDIVMADDSGLEVDALNKEPGIWERIPLILLKMQRSSDDLMGKQGRNAMHVLYAL